MKAVVGVLAGVALLPLLAGLALVAVLSGTPADAACSTAPSLVTAAAQTAGFTGPDLPIAVAVAQAESGGDPLATHVNADGSTDLGLWQINDRAHPDLAVVEVPALPFDAHDLPALRQIAAELTSTRPGA